ncbi:g140 [Yersinia phage phiR1-37]|uniref:hypothetical protein n=1 Tax=Yersinia phage phiR1-37 TaxID=331278 RepID=UPI00022DBD38|nr:hypothetical protein phiR1-37_gp140 [Yersinia phage phiR1-37]CCE26164.1 g140 [Yersinia phage phiR1-37]
MRVIQVKIRYELLSYGIYREIISDHYFKNHIEAFNLLIPNNQPFKEIPNHFGFTKSILSLSDLKYEYHLLDYVTNRSPLDENKVLKQMYMVEYTKSSLKLSKSSYRYIPVINLDYNISMMIPHYAI